MVNSNHYNDINSNYLSSYTGIDLINNDFVKLSLLFAEDRNKISEKKLNKKLNQLLNSFNDDQFVKEILLEITFSVPTVVFTTFRFADLGFVRFCIGINHIPEHLKDLSSVTTIK